MINKFYRKAALDIYGEQCELCGHRTYLEVHHINYQEHQEVEDLLRSQLRYANMDFAKSMEEAKKQGFLEYKDNQLAKDDSTKNLAVLCGNCHGLIHLMDVGKKLLKAVKDRK